MNGMQSAAAYSAAVAAQSTQAQPAPAAAHSTATPPQLQQAQLQQQAHASILRAFAPFRKPELSVAQREQQQKSRADIKNGITDAANVADADPPEDGDPDALLTEEHIQFLLNHHLRTPEDILFASPSRWPVYGVFPRSLLQQLQCRLRAGMESTCLSGTTLWRRAKCLQMVSIHPDIDRLLGGGLQQGAVTEVVASSSAGKTQFCIQAATMAAMSGKLVHVIDTSSTFEMARGQAMAQKWLEKTAKSSPVGHEWQPLSNIYIVRAFTAHAVLHTLDQLRHSLSSGQASPQLLVIDSLGGVIGPLVGAGKTRGHEYMMNVIREIKALAFEFEIAVLTTNYTVSSGHDKARETAMDPSQPSLMPALGDAWPMLADTRVFLEVDNAAVQNARDHETRKVVRLSIHRSHLKPPGETIMCELTAAGFSSMAVKPT